MQSSDVEDGGDDGDSSTDRADEVSDGPLQVQLGSRKGLGAPLLLEAVYEDAVRRSGGGGTEADGEEGESLGSLSSRSCESESDCESSH